MIIGYSKVKCEKCYLVSQALISNEAIACFFPARLGNIKLKRIWGCSNSIHILIVTTFYFNGVKK